MITIAIVTDASRGFGRGVAYVLVTEADYRCEKMLQAR